MSANVRFLGLVIGLTAIAVTGCGDTHVSLERERIAINKELMDSFASVKDLGDVLNTAPQFDAAAARMEKLAERRSKLKPATESEKSQIAKLREAEANEQKARAEKMRTEMANTNPAKMLAGGMPDLAKMQKYSESMLRYLKANAAYDPEQFGPAANMGLFKSGGGMSPPSKGGLIAIPPSGAEAPSP